MIDWLSVTVFLPHPPIPAGAILSVSSEGEQEWVTPRKTKIRGSFESSALVRSQGALDSNGNATELYIDVNPSKFLQGHNIFGSSCAIDLLSAVVSSITSSLGFCSSFCDISRSKVHRIDITHSFAFDTLVDVHQYISSLGLKTHSRMGRPVMRGHTVYFGKHSRRWSFKAYAKGDEIKKHKLPDNIPCRDLLITEAQNLVRCELTLRSQELKRAGYEKISDFTKEALQHLYVSYLERIDMTKNLKLPTDVIQSLKRAYRGTYFIWQNGICPRSMMSEPTFYRHRSYLMRYGVDIAIPLETDHTADVIPLKRLITGKPHAIPDWAYENGLVYQAM